MIKKGNLTTNDDLRALIEAIESGIIIIGDVQEQLEVKKKKDILSNHTYQIWQGTNGYWYTWVPKPDSPEKRRLMKRKSKSILEDDIINYYTKDDEQDQTTIVTLESLYYEWLDYKKLHTNASSSIRRIDCDWIKYYLSDPIINIPLVQMDKLMLDNWAHKKIKDNDMTKKQYYNMSIILRQSLMYAVDKKILTTSPFKDVIINTKLFRKVKKRMTILKYTLMMSNTVLNKQHGKNFIQTHPVLHHLLSCSIFKLA